MCRLPICSHLGVKKVPDIIPDDEYGDEPELAVFDPVGTLLRRFSDKLHELDLLPVQFNEHRRNSAHCSDIIYALVRHGLFVSGLLAVACSVLVASYLVHKGKTQKFPNLPS